jgi:hypothetical protein
MLPEGKCLSMVSIMEAIQNQDSEGPAYIVTDIAVRQLVGNISYCLTMQRIRARGDKSVRELDNRTG